MNHLIFTSNKIVPYKCRVCLIEKWKKKIEILIKEHLSNFNPEQEGK